MTLRRLSAGLAVLTVLVVGAAPVSGQDPIDLSDRGTVTASVHGSGTGRITSSPPGIDCRPACKGRFPRGATVILTATPSARSAFTGWTGGCAGRSTWCVFVARGNLSTRARFTKRPGDDSLEEVADSFVTRPILRVTVAVKGGGRVTSRSGEISCWDRCSHYFDQGSRVVLRAQARPGYRFKGWSSLIAGCPKGSETCAVRMNTTTDVAATFEVGG